MNWSVDLTDLDSRSVSLLPLYIYLFNIIQIEYFMEFKNITEIENVRSAHGFGVLSRRRSSYHYYYFFLFLF